MTAVIKLKGRDEIVKLPDEEGKRLMAMWLDTEGTPRNALVPLGGNLAVELREVKSIEILEEKVEMEPVENIEERQQAEENGRIEWLKLQPKDKLLHRYEEIIGGFKTRYKFKNEGRKPAEELLREAEQNVLSFLAQNPTVYVMPKELFNQLFVK